eukprot:7224936-Pyramimonas_sp.AAC.1
MSREGRRPLSHLGIERRKLAGATIPAGRGACMATIEPQARNETISRNDNLQRTASETPFRSLSCQLLHLHQTRWDIRARNTQSQTEQTAPAISDFSSPASCRRRRRAVAGQDSISDYLTLSTCQHRRRSPCHGVDITPL